MREIFCSKVSEVVDGKSEESIKEVEEVEAEYKHICYHDEKNPRPCKLVKIDKKIVTSELEQL